MYDVIIIGGGMAGASLACALEGHGLSLALVEARPFRDDAQPSYDDRVLALAHGSVRIFRELGLWQGMRGAAAPIRRIHVSDRGHFGAARMDAASEGVDALGYVIGAREIGHVLNQALGELKDTQVICPASMHSIEVNTAAARVTVEADGETRQLQGRLVVAADGTQSPAREQMHIACKRWEYGQTAIIANVTPDLPHHDVAYERFTDSGPLAMLPMTDERCSLVWTVRHEQVDEVMGWDEATFLRRLQARFGYRLGRIRKAGARHAYPLALIRAEQYVAERMALIGNAAHTLHPVAGQGFNLGIRDVAVLAGVIRRAARAGRDVGDVAVLDEYARWRQGDLKRTVALTDTLVRVFSNPLPPVVAARNLGLLAFDLLPPLKRLLTRQTMGMNGSLPRLGNDHA
jgi:2-octaprenyl-6-methoxyphenol hydroxylase